MIDFIYESTIALAEHFLGHTAGSTMISFAELSETVARAVLARNQSTFKKDHGKRLFTVSGK